MMPTKHRLDSQHRPPLQTEAEHLGELLAERSRKFRDFTLQQYLAAIAIGILAFPAGIQFQKWRGPQVQETAIDGYAVIDGKETVLSQREQDYLEGMREADLALARRASAKPEVIYTSQIMQLTDEGTENGKRIAKRKRIDIPIVSSRQ